MLSELFSFVNSVSLGFNLLQLLSMLLIPISRKAVFDLNSKLVGTVWRLMQYVFDRLDRAPILVKDGVDQVNRR